jgi:hypothetical protein
MLFPPKLFGIRELTGTELADDRKKALKIGPCGVGEKALYLNSFYFSRRYYVCWSDISRVFKRIAMTRGGYTGKGVFASVPYLIVQLKDGREKQCNFKFESKVDDILSRVKEKHPEIPVYSAEAEARLRKQQKEEDELYLKKLGPAAERTVKQLVEARDWLEKRPELYKQLVFAAKQKRIVDNIKPSVQLTAFLIAFAAVCSTVFGVIAMQMGHDYGLMFVLFGAGVFVMVMATRILPSKHRNRKSVQKDWDQAVSEMKEYLRGKEKFPVPPQYAHPIVLNRMIRAVRQGHASDADGALDAVKSRLKALNKTVTVTQKEYDEVATVKPLFLVCGYK